MKKLLIAFLTFTIGIMAFNLLKSRETSTSAILTMENKTFVASQSSLENIPIERIKYSKSFFDSFNEDEGFSGWLIADNFKGMKEVWTILLTTDNEHLKDNKVWSAMVLTDNPDGSSNDDDNFQSVRIKTENNHLSFKTNKIRGIEYKFDGEFFKNGKDFSNDEKVLKGTMQKIVKGKVVAKFTADFAYLEPHCFH